uniref:Uncharacterized protein n=1 Tax=Rangifer tarandus platyrhynchus TaxID=3082113 RepID=A0ACB0EDA9_RANTA|nr:unnamed protein product [Rangifer tarandus platyrhynchus]
MRAAAPAPVFVYKPGSARKRNRDLLPGAWRRCQPGRRGRRGPGVGDIDRDWYAEGAASLSAPPSTRPLLPAPQPTRKGSRSTPLPL